ncbi:UDP-N-acetylmuramoyl-L-alanyl-D-glutamate--2,6-diaminopimelate ligase [Patescibacteria group bacterium]|nr:UDP-N-acetylmuramoyl-L-alanyl-D-glutamate--2,6-diaminopimelate ligase [Patescibacteria group bacterium]
MKLSELLVDIPVKEVHGSDDLDVTSIHQDSRDQNLDSSLYVAIFGTQVDGHDFIDEVIGKGAVAIVCEQLPETLSANVTYIQVKDAPKALGIIAANFYGNSTHDLTVIAVTGTNGKTSVVHYGGQLLQALGEKPLVLSTAGDTFDGRPIDIDRKAPSSLEVIELQRVARTYLDQGATHLLIEATSQALDQNRLASIDVDVGVFTNLGQDHLDYHETLERYMESKKRLFDGLSSESMAVYNANDQHASLMVSDTEARIVSVGSAPEHDYTITLESMDLESMTIDVAGRSLRVPVIGAFNVVNVGLVYAFLVELGYQPEDLTSSIENLRSVPGRMEQVPNDHGILAIVDYAHSPDALENVLQTLGQLPHKKIITVFGCAGDRDPGKRIPMAQLAERYSDLAIATSDNPRTEDPNSIIDQVCSGFTNHDTSIAIVDRREAIEYAVKQTTRGDILLVAGKGDEDYQDINNKKIHFDDREELARVLTKKS